MFYHFGFIKLKNRCQYNYCFLRTRMLRRGYCTYYKSFSDSQENSVDKLVPWLRNMENVPLQNILIGCLVCFRLQSYIHLLVNLNLATFIFNWTHIGLCCKAVLQLLQLAIKDKYEVKHISLQWKGDNMEGSCSMYQSTVPLYGTPYHLLSKPGFHSYL